MTPVRSSAVALRLVLAFVALAATGAQAEPEIRIAVGRFRRAVSIEADDLSVLGGDGKAYPVEKGAVKLAPSSSGITLGGKSIDSALLRIRSKGLITLAGHSYRENLEVSWRLHKGRAELLVVHPIEMETYVTGIVSSELPKKWPLEALKAQAIAARTYAIWQKYRRLDLPYHMESSVLDQVYHGAEREHPDAIEAVRSTRGVVLTYQRRPAQAYFHATCGGHTESAKAGWGVALPYLPGSKCGDCTAANRYRWSAEVSWDELDRAFRGLLKEPITDLEVLKKSRTGRIAKVRLKGKRRRRDITGADLRRLVGYTRLWSTLITDIKKSDKGVRFSGRGAGHGVGMCQWGARGMAQRGQSVDAILKRYYPDATQTRMY